MKETEIQLAICEYLALRRVFFWRQNTNPVFDKASGSVRRMPKHSMNGVSDIIAVKKGVAYFLEVKRPKGVQSENQKEFQRLVEENGGVYRIVQSIDDVQAIGL